MDSIVLYTVITGGYDDIPPLPKALVQGIECYLVTDDPTAEIPAESAWRLKVVPREKDAHRHQRRLKLRFHDLFPEADTVVYMDANLHLTKPLKYVLPLHKGGFTTSGHPTRTCVYEEGEACARLNKAPLPLIREQMDAYRREGVAPRSGMYQTNFIIRSNTPEVRAFCENWFDELSRYTHRDQLSIIPVQLRMGFPITGVPCRTVQGFARLTKHASGGARYAQIHYLTPYAVDGNIGKAYNDACDAIPGDNDWIVIRDGDTLFTTPNWGRHVEEVLRVHGDTYRLYGAMTNRIRSEHQRVPDMFDEMDIRKHVDVGMELERTKYGLVHDGGSGVAGFFMAFRKTTWKKTPFRERERTFDTLFSKEVIRSGGRIGIMSGLYILHLYRMWSDNPISDITHLSVVSRR